jgi:gliding motility-associated-like protein
MKKQSLHISFLLLATLFLASLSLRAQTTLGFQGGEPGDTWTYTSTGADATAQAATAMIQNKITGTRSIVVGGNSSGGSCIDGGSGSGPDTPRTFTFSSIDISSSSAFVRTLKFNWGNYFPTCVGTGWDSGEDLVFTPYHNGVAQTPITLVVGSSNAAYSIQSNQYTYSIPVCVNQFYFKISVTTNRRDELLFLEDVKLTTPDFNPSMAQPSPITGNTIVCAGSTETYGVTAVPTTVYTWSGLPAGATFTTSNGTAASNNITVNWGTAAPATYTLTITPSDPCGNPGTPQTINVTVNAQPSPLTITGPDSFCPNETIVLTSSAASGNLWSTGETSPSISVTTAGNYTVSVTAACGSVNASHPVTANDVPVASITPNGPTTFCSGNSVVLTSAAATGNLWSTNATTSSISVNTGGTYTLTVTNTCGTDNASVTVTVTPSVITAVITADGPTTFCPGGNVTLTSNQTSGNLWSTGATTQSITVTTGGTYSLAVSNGCANALTSQTVTVSGAPVAAITANGPVTFCTGGSVILTSNNTTGNSWSTGATTQSITVSTAGTYTLTVSSSCGTSTDDVQVIVNAGATVQITGGNSFCTGDSLLLTASGGTDYVWSDGTLGSTLYIAEAGNYTVAANGTCGQGTASISVVESTVNANFTANTITTSIFVPVIFTNTSSPNATTNFWDFGDGENSTADSPLHAFETGGTFEVSLTVTTNEGCTDTFTAEILVMDQPSSLHIPNVFSPNGDQSNDFFTIEVSGIQEYHLSIFNRWGEILIETNDPKESWDGKYKGNDASEGTYYYTITGRGLDQKDFQEKGFLTLIR